MPTSIAIIDDDEDDLFFANREIAKTGCRNPIIAFRDAAEAIRHFEKLDESSVHPTGMVFCDIRMPLVSGFEVLARLRELAACRTLPVYMLSGSSLEEDRARAATLGANGYLVKFPSTQEFAALIARHCP